MKYCDGVVVALEVANDALEEHGESTALQEIPDTLGVPREEKNDLTNNKVVLHLPIFTVIIEYSVASLSIRSSSSIFSTRVSFTSL